MVESTDTDLQGFKETNMNSMPADWGMAAVGDAISETTSGDWGKPTNEDHPDWIRCQVIRGTDFPEVAAGRLQGVPERYVRPSSVEKRQLQPDDMLVEISGGSKYQPTGRVLRITPAVPANAQLPLLFTNFVKRYRVNQRMVAPSFFHLFWEHLYALGRTRIYEKRTTGIRNFKHKEFLAEEHISLPSLPEQRRIAHVLSTVQRAIEAQDNVVAAAKDLKRSVMQRLFTYGPAPEPASTKETEIGEVPGSWEVVSLGELARVVRGGSPRPKGDPKYFADKPTGIHWIMISDLTKYKKGKFITSTEEYLTEEGKKKSRYLTIGTFVVTNSGTVGIPAFLGINGCIHDGYLALLDIDRSRINEEYLYYWFVLIKRYLERIAPRGTQANLNTTIAKNLQIPIPSLPLQREIAHVLSAVDRRIEAEENRMAALQELLRSMLHQLMTGQLRVTDLEV